MPEAKQRQQDASAGEVDRIVRAAREALGRAGYENLKVKSVIRSAGVSVGSFYRRFRGKQDLMLALVADEARRNTRFLTKVTAHGTAPERVLAWVDATAGVGFAEGAGARTRWFSSMPADIRRLLNGMIEQDSTTDTAEPLRRAIADGITSGDFPHAEARRDALSIRALSAVAGTDQAGWFGDTREEVVTHVARFVMAALTNPLPRMPPSTDAAQALDS
jgi:AcrR family transcriptional regulator